MYSQTHTQRERERVEFELLPLARPGLSGSVECES